MEFPLFQTEIPIPVGSALLCATHLQKGGTFPRPLRPHTFGIRGPLPGPATSRVFGLGAFGNYHYVGPAGPLF